MKTVRSIDYNMELLENIVKDIEDCRITGNPQVEINNIEFDSRKVSPGDLFVAIKGGTSDGHEFIDVAIQNGASAVMGENNITDCKVPYVQVGNSRKSMAITASAFYGHPGRAMTIIGITGTNGKTTTTYLIDSILFAGGIETGLLGTIGYRAGEASYPAHWTTPESTELHRLLNIMKEHGTETVVMEVSSHALDQYRVEGLKFRLALFTNLTQDHLDYHRSMESYADVKKKLFRLLDDDKGENIINGDDPIGAEMANQNHRPALFYSATPGKCEIYPESAELDLNGIKAVIKTPKDSIAIDSKLIGKHNLYNIMTAVASGHCLGIPKEAISKGISEMKFVPGRLEPVEAEQPFSVLVDYAHTPDAVEKAIIAVKDLVKGKLIVLFGCGGDRDKGKRPKMGHIAEKMSDLAILTSDNPRMEDPQSIIDDVLEGIKDRSTIEVRIDRTQAIHLALDSASENDCVLLLGKGHETYQILGSVRIHYDDREVAKDHLEKLYKQNPEPANEENKLR